MARRRRHQTSLSTFFQSSDDGRNRNLSIIPSVLQESELLRRSSKRQKGEEAKGHTAATGSRFGTCPLCQACFPLHILALHAETCDGSIQSQSKEQNHLDGEKNVAVPRRGTDSNDTAFSNSAAQLAEATRSNEHKRREATKVPWWKAMAHRAETENYHPHTSEPLPGLYLYENFITKEEEYQIIAELDGTSREHRSEFLPWKHANFNGPHNGKRWGVHCNLRDRRVDAPENPLPHFIRKLLLEKFLRLKPMVGCIPNEANAIDYRRRAGHFLQSHVDDRQLSKEPIANLSIAGDCIMTFKNEKLRCPDGAGLQPERVLLKSRTLQILTGKARYDYSHGIRNQDLLSDRRVSVTMRESPLTKT